MRVLLVGAALMLMFVSAMLFLVRERKASGRDPSSSRFSVIGHVTGDFAGAPWAGAVAKLGSEQALIPPSGRFSFVVPPGRHSIGVCCSPEFLQIEETVEVVDRDVELTLVARPSIEVSGRVSVAGETPIPAGLTISATLQGTMIVDRAVPAADGSFNLQLGEGKWELTVDNLPEGYAPPEIHYAGSKLTGNVLVIRAAPRTVSVQIVLKRG